MWVSRIRNVEGVEPPKSVHHTSAIVGSKMYIIGGKRTEKVSTTGQIFVFDFGIFKA